MKRKVTLLLLLFCIFTLHAQGVYKTDKDLSYVSDEETDAYRKERCKLDVPHHETIHWMSTIRWTRKISLPLYGFMVGDWKVAVSIFHKN